MSDGTNPDLQKPPRVDVPTLVDHLKDHLHSLVICLSHSWGGLEQVAANDAEDIGALGLDVRVLCLEGSPLHEHLAHLKNVKAVPLSFRPRNFFDLKLRAELQKLFDEGVNLIQTHQPSLLPSLVPWLWFRHNVALIASRHIMNNHDKRDPFHQALYSRVDALVVMSETLKENVLNTHPIKPRKVKLINLGLDFSRFDPVKVDPKPQRAEWGADEETLVIGMVGRIDPAKGQATFIRAAANLLKGARFGEKIKFIMVGEETLGRASTHLEELKQMVAQFHLEDYVVFAGYQENIPEIMRAFDVFVMPSRQEAFGLVAIEAMAMECPIVISSGGSAAEIVGNQEYGLLVRPEDAFDLHQQLRYLIDHPEIRARMGKRAREHVIENYERRVRVHRTLELYERSLRRRAHL